MGASDQEGRPNSMAASAPAGRAIFVGAKRPEPGQHLQSDRERGNGQWRVTMLPVSEATSSLIELAARRAVSPRPRPERSISKRCFVRDGKKGLPRHPRSRLNRRRRGIGRGNPFHDDDAQLRTVGRLLTNGSFASNGERSLEDIKPNQRPESRDAGASHTDGASKAWWNDRRSQGRSRRIGNPNAFAIAAETVRPIDPGMPHDPNRMSVP